MIVAAAMFLYVPSLKEAPPSEIETKTLTMKQSVKLYIMYSNQQTTMFMLQTFKIEKHLTNMNIFLL